MKKTKLLLPFIVFLFSFPAFAQETSSPSLDEPNNKFLEFKQKFYELIELRELAIAYKEGEIYLTEEEIGDIKEKILGYLEETFQELNKPGYQPYVQLLREQANSYLPETVAVTLNQVINISKLDLSTEEKVDEIITGLTIIGIPVGLILNLFSWVPFFLGMLIIQMIPIIGIPIGGFFVILSVVISAIGWIFYL